MGEFLDLTEKIVTVEAGQAAILDLPAIESYPEPLVIWQTDQTTFSSSYQDIIAGITHQLIILSVSENHQKSYRFVQQVYRVANTFFYVFGLRSHYFSQNFLLSYFFRSFFHL